MPLERLLRVKPAAPEPRPIPLSESPPPAAPPAARSGLGDRLRVEHEREDLGPAGPRDVVRRRTDVGVAVPVDEGDRVRLRGGVRVDQEEDSQAGSRQVEPSPSVGVELRF